MAELQTLTIRPFYFMTVTALYHHITDMTHFSI